MEEDFQSESVKLNSQIVKKSNSSYGVKNTSNLSLTSWHWHQQFVFDYLFCMVPNCCNECKKHKNLLLLKFRNVFLSCTYSSLAWLVEALLQRKNFLLHFLLSKTRLCHEVHVYNIFMKYKDYIIMLKKVDSTLWVSDLVTMLNSHRVKNVSRQICLGTGSPIRNLKKELHRIT